MVALIVIVILFLGSTAGAVAGENSVGMLLKTQGDVKIFPWGNRPRPGLPLEDLFAGNEVATGSGATATLVLFAGGREYALTPNTRVRIYADRIEKVAGNVQSGRPGVALNLPEGSKIKSLRLMGETTRNGSVFSIHSPVSGSTIREGAYTFRWSFKADPDRVTVIIRDFDLWHNADIDKVDLIELEEKATVARLPVSGTSLSYPPPGLAPLKAGGRYSLYVVPMGPGDRVEDVIVDGYPESEFYVLPEKERDVLREKEKAVEDLSRKNPADPVPLMKLARIYIEMDLYDEALNTALRLQKMMPENPNVYRMMAGIYSRMGMPGKRDEAKRKAQKLERKI